MPFLFKIKLFLVIFLLKLLISSKLSMNDTFESEYNLQEMLFYFKSFILFYILHIFLLLYTPITNNHNNFFNFNVNFVKLLSNLFTTKVLDLLIYLTLYTRNLKYQHSKPVFRLHNNLCEFKTYTHTFDGLFCVSKGT